VVVISDEMSISESESKYDENDIPKEDSYNEYP